jgi:predicted DCC family thiol-disulfide oxidoreductase YuxK
MQEAVGGEGQTSFTTDPPLFIFDGFCVLCSTGVAFIMKHDRRGRVRFLSAQTDLGSRIYRQLNKPLDDSYIFIDPNGVHMKTDGWFRVAGTLGGGWRFWTMFRLIPRPIRDWAYDILARNRYQWFGKSQQCAILTPEQRQRLVTDDEGLRALLN